MGNALVQSHVAALETDGSNSFYNKTIINIYKTRVKAGLHTIMINMGLRIRLDLWAPCG